MSQKIKAASSIKKEMQVETPVFTADMTIEEYCDEIDRCRPSEIWKNLLGFRNLYQVSNHKRVKSSDGRILTQFRGQNGRMQVTLESPMTSFEFEYYISDTSQNRKRYAPVPNPIYDFLGIEPENDPNQTDMYVQDLFNAVF